MFSADGEQHRRLRTAVTNALTPQSVRALQPRLDEIVATLVRDLPRNISEDGSVDLCRYFANPLPLNVICELLGVPEYLHSRIRDLTASVFDHTIQGDQVNNTQKEILRTMAELVTYRSDNHGKDLTSSLIVTRRENPELLTEEELYSTLWLVASAGHETTRNLLVNAVRALLKHPGQLAMAREGATGTWEAVVEETLRWDGPVGNILTRVALVDITIADVTIPAGEAIVAPYSAVGRDPLKYGEDAERFDITRKDKKHMAFGGGPHFCVGALLARREAVTALPALMCAYPHMRLAVDDTAPKPLPSMLSNSVMELPVHLMP
ncbi:cytochrome P450 [Streptomyces inhibens]|nr:cytochrome P450 [Streptomyces inhibens]